MLHHTKEDLENLQDTLRDYINLADINDKGEKALEYVDMFCFIMLHNGFFD